MGKGEQTDAAAGRGDDNTVQEQGARQEPTSLEHALGSVLETLRAGATDNHLELDAQAEETLAALTQWLMESRLSRVAEGDWRSGLEALKQTAHIADAPLRNALTAYVNRDQFVGGSRVVASANDRSELTKRLNALMERANIQPKVPQSTLPPKWQTNLCIAGGSRIFCVSHRETPTEKQTTTPWHGARGDTLPQKLEFASRQSYRSR